METPTLSFLIGIIISILVGVALVLGFLKITEGDRQSLECFNGLSKAINGLKEGENKIVTCSLNFDWGLLGFDSRQEAIVLGLQGKVAGPTGTQEGKLVNLRQPECAADKPCLCLCRKIRDRSTLASFCSEKAVCNSFDGFTTLSGYDYSWASLSVHDDFALPEYDGVISLVLSKKGNDVNICDKEGGCILPSNENLSEEIGKCKTRKDCDCGLHYARPLRAEQKDGTFLLSQGFFDNQASQFYSIMTDTLDGKLCVADQGRISYLDEMLFPDSDYEGYWEFMGERDQKGTPMKIRLVNVHGDVCFGKVEKEVTHESEDLTCEVSELLEESGSVPLK